MFKFFSSVPRLALCAAAVSMPAALAAAIAIAPDRPDALYRAGEEASFAVTVSDGDGNVLKSGEATWRLDNFGDGEIASGTADLANGNPFTVKGTLGEPGFLRLAVKSATDSFVQSVGYDVEKIRQDEPCPADFDEYWTSEKARLEREVPIDARKTLDARLSNETQDVYRVNFATFGGKRVYGFLRIPRPAPRPLPLVVQVTDAGRGAIGPWINVADAVSLTMNVHTFEPAETADGQIRLMDERNAELSREFGFRKPVYCGVIGIGVSREAYHFHDVMLGINRAVDWAAALPEVDSSRVAYFGSSQGGGFGLFLNYLNGKFSRAMLAVCAITGHYGYKQKRADGWPKLVASQPNAAAKANAERYAAYFDGVNFAARIRHGVRFVVGFRDQTCPPHCVYSAYNVCPSADKAIINAVGSNHGGWLKWCRENCRGNKEFDYLDWALNRDAAGVETRGRAGLAAMNAKGGEFAANGCRVEWSARSLSVGNGLFSKTYVSVGGVLRTASFKDASGSEWQTEKFSAADEISVMASGAKWSPAGADGVRVEVLTPSSTNVVWAFPGMPGVISEIQAGEKVAPAHDLERDIDKFAEWRESLREVAGRGDRIVYGLRHVKATSCVCADQTDIRDSLLHVEERLLMDYDAPFTAAATSLDCRDVLTGEGIVFVRIAPMQVSRPNKDDDFIIDGGTRTVAPIANGYPLAELAYRGGEAGRQRAVVAFQRALRPFRPGRDGVLLSNTWGAGNRDSRICQEFLLKEIDAGARIGVDVIQIDDGWQRGRTSNSKKKEIAGSKKVWNGYWAADPLFWTEDRERFPDGLDFLVGRAKEKGMRFGLWFGPDSSGEAANWERDADWLLGMHRKLGIDYYKMDSMKLRSPLALKRNRAMFDKMLRESGGAMVFDLDCTAEVRPGFFGLIDIGPLFVENRYTRKPIYWPHHTLKNLWDLAHMIDPVRLRFEFNNPDTNHGNYEWSPLSHARYRPDALFAIVMSASPLAWMELSDVAERSMADIASLVKVWKRERDRWYGGTMHPVGARPDGVSWTGFVSEAADGTGGYALLFRELNASADFTLDLSGIFGKGFRAGSKIIAGRGTAFVADGRMSVSIPERLDYVWVRFSGKE